MNQPWSDLPNAHHIDWVLASIKKNPELWAAAWDAASEVAGGEVRRAAWTAASETGYQEVKVAARCAAWGAAYSQAWGARSNIAIEAACSASLALVVYDDCDECLSMSYEKLTIWAALSENQAAVLLLPMVYVREKLHEPALV